MISRVQSFIQIFNCLQKSTFMQFLLRCKYERKVPVPSWWENGLLITSSFESTNGIGLSKDQCFAEASWATQTGENTWERENLIQNVYFSCTFLFPRSVSFITLQTWRANQLLMFPYLNNASKTKCLASPCFPDVFWASLHAWEARQSRFPVDPLA